MILCDNNPLMRVVDDAKTPVFRALIYFQRNYHFHNLIVSMRSEVSWIIITARKCLCSNYSSEVIRFTNYCFEELLLKTHRMLSEKWAYIPTAVAYVDILWTMWTSMYPYIEVIIIRALDVVFIPWSLSHWVYGDHNNIN